MIIIDTSVWVSLFIQNDSNNNKANTILLSIKHDDVIVFDYVYIECLNVLRAKFNTENCNAFMNFVNDLTGQIYFSDPAIVRLADYYFSQFKKLSFADCMILSSAKINDYQIATFDVDLQKSAKIALGQ